MSSDSGREKEFRLERKKRRNRSSNFLTREKEILIGLIGQYVNIISSKRTDSVALQEKEAAWTKISYEFNTNPTVISKRDTKSLKSWYDNFKRKVKNKLAENGSDESNLDSIEHKFVDVLLAPELENNGEFFSSEKVEAIPFSNIKAEVNGVSDDSSDRLVICEDQTEANPGTEEQQQVGEKNSNTNSNTNTNTNNKQTGRWKRRKHTTTTTSNRRRNLLSERFYLRAARSLRANVQLKRAILNQKLRNERLLAEVLRKKLEVLEAKLAHLQKERD